MKDIKRSLHPDILIILKFVVHTLVMKYFSYFMKTRGTHAWPYMVRKRSPRDIK